jgi:tRNA threonylcarbamoyladenosine biosynthesis protein TsaB
VIILAIDTATAVTSAAIVGDPVRGGTPCSELSRSDARRHAEALPQLVRRLLEDCGVGPGDIDVVACGVGPGPFTGLRVGVTFARAMALGLGVPCVGVCSLDVIAHGVADPPRTGMTVVTQHRRAEVAWATYTNDIPLRRTSGPLIVPAQSFDREGLVVGDAPSVDVVAYPSTAVMGSLVLSRLAAGEQPPVDRAWPEDSANGSGMPASVLLEALAARGDWLLPALPLYLRRPDAVPA